MNNLAELVRRLPEPYEDELWYSVLSRYHRMSGNLTERETYREIMPDMIKGAESSIPILTINNYCICCIQEALDDCRWERIRYFLAKVENRDLVYLVLGFTPDEGTSQEDLCMALETTKNAYTAADLGWIYRTLFGKWFKEDMPNATLDKWKEHHNYV